MKFPYLLDRGKEEARNRQHICNVASRRAEVATYDPGCITLLAMPGRALSRPSAGAKAKALSFGTRASKHAIIVNDDGIEVRHEDADGTLRQDAHSQKRAIRGRVCCLSTITHSKLSRNLSRG